MMTRRAITSGSVVAIALVGLALVANTATGTISNPGFEADVLSDGTGTGADIGSPITGWNKYGTASSFQAYNSQDVHFSGTTGDSPGTIPGTGDGVNVLIVYINNGVANRYGLATQVLPATPLTAGETYALTAAVGDSLAQPPMHWYIAIGTSGTGPDSTTVGDYLAYAGDTDTGLTDGTFVDKTVSYTATGNEDGIGENLRITVWGKGPLANQPGMSVWFDNLRLVVTPPVSTEPGTINNPGFEADVLSDGGGTGADIGSPITGWNKYGTASSLTAFNSLDNHFSGTTGDSPGTIPGTGDGVNLLLVYVNSGVANRYGLVTQVLPYTPLTANATYALTAAVGDSAAWPPMHWYIAIGTAGTGPDSTTVGDYLAYAGDTDTGLTDGTFVDKTVSYTATGSEGGIGENLRITLWGKGPLAAAPRMVCFDNLRLVITLPGTVLIVR